MRIGVVSDSHGNLYMLNKAIELMGEIDLLIHLGDHYQDAIKVNKKFNYELFYVSGNNDYSKPDSAERVLTIGGKRLFLTHGHRYGVSFDLMQLEYRAKELMVDIVLFGHTHKYTVDQDNGILYLNPGSVSRARDVSNSAAILNIAENGEVTVKKIIIT